MSGDVHRRHPARPVLAAALVCALIWLGLGSRIIAGPLLATSHPGVEIVAAPLAVPQVAQRAAARMGHLRAAVMAASQRQPFGAGPPRAVVIALLALFGIAAARRGAPRRLAVRMHGVRAPPFTGLSAPLAWARPTAPPSR
jgi:hypothetical protein